MRDPVEAPGGPVRLRAEELADEAFLRSLFRSSAAPLAGLPLPLAEQLLDMQFRSQSRTYRAAHPLASGTILEREGKPLGRLLVEPGNPALVVDYALSPHARNDGLGGTVLAEVLARMAVVTRANVLSSNDACLGMCARLGFRPVANDPPYICLEWRPSLQKPIAPHETP